MCLVVVQHATLPHTDGSSSLSDVMRFREDIKKATLKALRLKTGRHLEKLEINSLCHCATSRRTQR
jgi:hypothetical protein